MGKDLNNKPEQEQREHIEELYLELQALVDLHNGEPFKVQGTDLRNDIEHELQWEILRNRMAGFDSLLESSLSNEDLGKLIRYYFTEAAHGGWEGFNFQDLLGVAALVSDINLAFQAGDHPAAWETGA